MTRTAALLGSAVLPLSLLCAAAFPESGDSPRLRVVRHRAHYAVEGGDAASILASMRRHGRRVAEETAFAWTDARTEYSIRWARRAGECRTARVDVRVEVTVTLPSWTAAPETPTPLRRRWNRFRSRLEVHEAGHVRVARDGGARLLRELESLGEDECDAVKRAARGRAEAVLDEIHGEHLRYDRDTGNGRSQGVVWVVGEAAG